MLTRKGFPSAPLDLRVLVVSDSADFLQLLITYKGICNIIQIIL